MATLRNLKKILLSHLVDKGFEPSIIPGFIRCMVNASGVTSRKDFNKIKQRMCSMRWNGYVIDDDILNLAIVCIDAQKHKQLEDKPARWFEKKFKAA